MRRPDRLAETLREAISEVVGFELEDPRLQAATVTDVVMSPDSQDAKVYVLVDGDEAEIKAAFKGLQSAAIYIRRQVAMNLNLRHVPQLHFARDTAEENAQTVGSIIDELRSRGEFFNEEENE